MNVFPQLLTGAVCQTNIVRTVIRRLNRRRALDGFPVVALDPWFRRRQWKIALTEVTTAEKDRLEALFRAVEGRRREFLFLDPLDNLFCWSSDMTRPSWACGAGATLGGGVSDPWGGTTAAQLTTVTDGAGISQSVDAPPNMIYNLSAWLRSDEDCNVDLYTSGGGQTVSQRFATGATWRRVSLSIRLTAAGTAIEAGLLLPAPGTIQLAGPQLEAQPCPSSYKATFGTSGVFPKARFDHDKLVMRTIGPGSYEAVVSLSAPY